MNIDCKHKRLEGNTTKYLVCKAKDKAINDYDCIDCPLVLKNDNPPKYDLPKGFEELFGGFRK